jgi:hypothetical protein
LERAGAKQDRSSSRWRRISIGTSPDHERWHKSLKGERIRPGTPLSLEGARRRVQGYVEHYNNIRLNNAIGYTVHPQSGQPSVVVAANPLL